MEMEGHPTQDIVDELVKRGAIRMDGDDEGPGEASLAFLRERLGPRPGSWIFLPDTAFETGLDDLP